MNGGRRRAGVSGVLATVWLLCASLASATTSPTRGGADSLRIDGSSADFTADEAIFTITPGSTLYESSSDSRWGVNNEVLQLHVTWDKDSLYVAVDGVIWGNNVILLFDTTPTRIGSPRCGA